MICRRNLLQTQLLCLCFFSFALSLSVQAQDPPRHICKDGNVENYFSFVPPDGWEALNIEDYSAPSKTKAYRLKDQLLINPQSSTLVTVCYQKGGNELQQPLIFIFRTYPPETGTELEKSWSSQKYQKRRNKQLADPQEQPFLQGRNVAMYRPQFEYRQNIHAAIETYEGMIDDVPFIRIKAAILGGVQHATIVCYFEGDASYDAPAWIEQIVNSFEFEPENMFAGPLEQQQRQSRSFKMSALEIRVMFFFSIPIAVGAILGIWLSARYYGVPCRLYHAVNAGVLATLVLFLPPHHYEISLALFAVTTYGLLALFIRDDYWDGLMKVTGFGLLVAMIGIFGLLFYIFGGFTIFHE